MTVWLEPAHAYHLFAKDFVGNKQESLAGQSDLRHPSAGLLRSGRVRRGLGPPPPPCAGPSPAAPSSDDVDLLRTIPRPSRLSLLFNFALMANIDSWRSANRPSVRPLR